MRYFTIDELCHSDTADGMLIDNSCPSDVIRENLEALVGNILDPLREAWGKPIRVTSGYRCQKLNRLVGGAATSQHLYGQAADITVGGRSDNKRLFGLVRSLGLPFDQLIDENGYRWVHVSYSPRNRRQVLRL